MNCAIYARKSTEQNVAADAKSVNRQVENARAFAAGRGWAVADEHIFKDDGFSGAEFEKRPGLQRLLALLGPAAPFQVLVVSEQKSIGREAFATNYIIKQLAEAGVEVFGYMSGRSLTPKNWMEKVMSAVQAGADEAHREQTAARMREAHGRLARNGYVTGGRLFGYRNVDKFNGVDQHGRPLRSHVEREIEPTEAAVVLRIFEMYASGLGLKRIAKQLTAERAPSPKYSRHVNGEPGEDLVADLPAVEGWAPTTVGGVLTREVYRGVIVWNRARKRNDWGKVDVQSRPESEWVRTPAEHLRIVPEELWHHVASRRADVERLAMRFESGRLSGRPPRDWAAQNLLAGLATCGVCGGGLVISTSSGPRGDAFDLDSLPRPGERARPARSEPYRYYVCARRRLNSSCVNTLRLPADLLEEAVLEAVEEHALTPEAVERVIRLTERDELAAQRDALAAEAADVDAKVARLVAAVESGGELAPLTARLRELQARRKVLADEMAGLRPVPRLAPRVVESRLEEWRRLLRASTTQGRAVLQRVLRGRITFTPTEDGTGYDFSAPTRFDKLFSGFATPLPPWMNDGGRLGHEHIRPEDTMDPDYERVLERAERALGGGSRSARKGMRPWRDSNPRSSP